MGSRVVNKVSLGVGESWLCLFLQVSNDLGLVSLE